MYHTVKEPSSYSTAERLLKAAQKEDTEIKLSDVKDWLKKQYAYTVHRRAFYKIPLRKVRTERIGDCWSADLIDISGLSSYNSGFSWIATFLDNFSRFAWARELKRKTTKETGDALLSVIAANEGSPYRLWSDDGTEWTSLKNIYELEEIERYSTRSPIKATLIERFNKTLQNSLYKAMTARNTVRWVDLLQDTVHSYNHRVHSSLHGLTPFEAHKKENEEFLRQKFREDRERYKKKVKEKQSYTEGDQIRVVKRRKLFSRGYEDNYEPEIRTVEEVYPTHPRTFRVSGKHQRFYSREIIPAESAEKEAEKIYFIERTRTVGAKTLRSGNTSGGQTEYLLKARNQPDISTWVSEAEIQRLRDGGLLE